MPGIIAALRLQRNGRKVTVEMVGAESFSLSLPLADGLHPGQALEESAIEELTGRERLETVYRRCLALIARRPRSRTELQRYLRARKTEDAAAQEVLRRLAERGLLDDRDFARQWVENRQAFRPRSRRALQAELRRLGVAEPDARDALSSVRENDAALAAARKKAARLYSSVRGTPKPRQTFENKMTAFLASRGFDFDLSRETARTIWQDTADPARPEGES
jgi:regulatory protein